MIGSIKQDDGFVRLFDSGGTLMATIGLGSDQILRGYSDSIVVASAGGFYTVYDESGRQKAFFGVAEARAFLAVVGDTIQFKEGGSTIVYDQNGNYLRHL